MTARWASVPDAHDYLVSDAGDVRRMLPYGTWRPIRAARNSKGYAKVCLTWTPCDTGCRRHKQPALAGRGHVRQEYVHRLVWLAFRGPIPDDQRVDHIDDNQVNNALTNLQLLTDADNNDKRLGRWQDDPGWGEYNPAEREEGAA